MTDLKGGESFTPGPLARGERVYVAGHRGLVGSAIVRKLEAEGFSDIVGRTSAELDLKDRDAVFAFLREVKPKVVVLAAVAAIEVERRLMKALNNRSRDLVRCS